MSLFLNSSKSSFSHSFATAQPIDFFGLNVARAVLWCDSFPSVGFSPRVCSSQRPSVKNVQLFFSLSTMGVSIGIGSGCVPIFCAPVQRMNLILSWYPASISFIISSGVPRHGCTHWRLHSSHLQLLGFLPVLRLIFWRVVSMVTIVGDCRIL